jgi:hypothetical protein
MASRALGQDLRVGPQERGLLGRIGMVAKTRGQGNFLRTEDATFAKLTKPFEVFSHAAN